MRAGLQTPGEWATAPGTHTCKGSSSQGMAASAPGVCNLALQPRQNFP